MKTSTKKKISFMVLIWTILLAMIYTGGGAVHVITSPVIGIIHFAVAIMWGVIAVLAAKFYATLTKTEIIEQA